VGNNADKRARQKQNRDAARKALGSRGSDGRRARRTPLIVATIAVLAVVVGVVVLFAGGEDKSDDDTTTTTAASSTGVELPAPAEGITLSSETPCPPAEGTEQRVQVFAGPPPTCIQPAEHSYSATFTTSEGEFTAVLDADDAPVAVNNFVVLARYHYFDGVPFHRIVPGFVIQAGDGDGEPWGNNDLGYSIPDELPEAGDTYSDYSLAMANSGPDTGGSQFFVVLPGGGAQLGPQYTRFGEVTEGREVVDAIGSLGGTDEQPTKAVVIETVTVTEGPPAAGGSTGG
jgi:cyclophilin family peptidyl-prolyl cis-trans isomerase